jgi:Neuraminidase (sialidase)
MLKSSDMRIISPANLPEKIKCKRIPVGGMNGYKPNVVKLSTGELLMTNFHMHYENQGDGTCCEHIMLFRSGDNGLTWSACHYDHLHGREPYLNVFSNDVVVITTHFLANDVRNKTGHTMIMLHRSEDQGHTWESREIDISMVPDEVDPTCSSRNIIELDDGNIMMKKAVFMVMCRRHTSIQHMRKVFSG